MSKSKLVHSEIYNRDGIDYEIRVVQAGGGLWGEWTCTRCGQSGASSAKDSSVKMALLAGKTNLGGHHAMTHVIKGDLPPLAVAILNGGPNHGEEHTIPIGQSLEDALTVLTATEVFVYRPKDSDLRGAPQRGRKYEYSFMGKGDLTVKVS